MEEMIIKTIVQSARSTYRAQMDLWFLLGTKPSTGTPEEVFCRDLALVGGMKNPPKMIEKFLRRSGWRYTTATTPWGTKNDLWIFSPSSAEDSKIWAEFFCSTEFLHGCLKMKRDIQETFRRLRKAILMPYREEGRLLLHEAQDIGLIGEMTCHKIFNNSLPEPLPF